MLDTHVSATLIDGNGELFGYRFGVFRLQDPLSKKLKVGHPPLMLEFAWA